MDTLALGQYLRETRIAKELDLDDAVSALKIRRSVLESFEAGNFDVTSASAVQVHGFLRNYASFLGLDPDLIIRYYQSAMDGGSSGLFRRKRDDIPAPKARKSITDTNPSLPAVTMGEREMLRSRRTGSILTLLVQLLVGVAALAVIAFVTVQLINIPSGGDGGDSDGFSALDLPPSPTRTIAPTFTPAANPTALPQIHRQYTGQGVLVIIEFSQRGWISLSVDGVEQYAGLAIPGVTVLEYEGREVIEVTASNAESLVVTYNGNPQGSFGGRGQRVDITFGQNDMEIVTGPGFDPTAVESPTPIPTSPQIAATLLAQQTPSATPGPSPTPTITPTPSDTPTITLTPSITPTPSDTPTITLTPTLTLSPTDTLTPTITPTPSETAILPPRVPQVTPTPTKDGA